MPYHASVFTHELPQCPRCLQSLRDLHETCRFCDFTFEQSQTRFPFEPPALERFIDPESQLVPKVRAALNRRVEGLERTFSGLAFCHALVSLPQEADPREFGFWLINSAPLPSDKEAKEKEKRQRTVLLVYDRRGRRASLTVGYQLDPILTDAKLRALLEQANKSPAHSAGDFLKQYFLSLTTTLQDSLFDAQERSRLVYKEPA
ncbi:MAG: hypothetical protein AAF555_01090 [Verrucomicrobiota bacterium]